MRSGRATSPVVNVGMTEPAIPLLHDLHDQWGGKVEKARAATDKWAAAWRWILLGSNCRPFLEWILPDLRMKVEQATLAISLMDLRESLVPVDRVNAVWTDEALEQAWLIKDRIHELNAKGPMDPDGQTGWTARLVGDRWVTPQQNLLSPSGLDLFSGPLPTSGTTVRGQLFERPMWDAATSAIGGSLSRGLPTPTSRDGKDGPETATRNLSAGHMDDTLPKALHQLMRGP